MIISWRMRHLNGALLIFAWGMIFRMLFGESDWIAVLIVSFFLGFRVNKRGMNEDG
nr:MAG TPA: hypothetical protein [Caudoviricetes sp.]